MTPTLFGQEFVSEMTSNIRESQNFSLTPKNVGHQNRRKLILDLSGGNGVFINEFKKMGARSVAHTEFSRDAVICERKFEN